MGHLQNNLCIGPMEPTEDGGTPIDTQHSDPGMYPTQIPQDPGTQDAQAVDYDSPEYNPYQV